MHTILSTTVLVAAVAMAYPAAVTAQAGRGGQGPRYDTSTEVTVRGTVREVREVADSARGGSATGTHLVVKTEKETLEIHLGPTAFITEQKMSLAQGDEVEITGSRLKVAAGDALIAREIRKGTQTVTLRDDKGIPKWSRGRR
jgi:hypothetical protein